MIHTYAKSASPEELFHYGVKGMKWGVRRSQRELDRSAGRIANATGSNRRYLRRHAKEVDRLRERTNAFVPRKLPKNKPAMQREIDRLKARKDDLDTGKIRAGRRALKGEQTRATRQAIDRGDKTPAETLSPEEQTKLKAANSTNAQLAKRLSLNLAKGAACVGGRTAVLEGAMIREGYTPDVRKKFRDRFLKVVGTGTLVSTTYSLSGIAEATLNDRYEARIEQLEQALKIN